MHHGLLVCINQLNEHCTVPSSTGDPLAWIQTLLPGLIEEGVGSHPLRIQDFSHRWAPRLGTTMRISRAHEVRVMRDQRDELGTANR